MACRVLVFAVAAAALLSLCAAPDPAPAAPTDSRPRCRPTFSRMRRTLPPPHVSSRAAFEELWAKQILDHFDSTNTNTWDQRYYRDDSYYIPGGPVFLFVSGNSGAYYDWLGYGFMHDLAQQHGALMLMLEHRFYGFSYPTEDWSPWTLRYLNSSQALEDLAYFIRQQRRDDPRLDSARWVVFGGSYAGSLAAWARLRYPDIVDGAVASSAPVLAQANFPEYLEVVSEVLQLFDSECVSEIAEASRELDQLLQSDAGVSRINELFGLCPPLNASNEYHAAGVAFFAADMFSDVVENNDVSTAWESSVQINCEMLRTSQGDSALERLTNLLGLGYPYCIAADYETIYQEELATGRGVTARQWLWQRCTEFGFFPTTDSANQPFGSRLTMSYFTYACALLFGPEYTVERVEQGVRNTNLLYGGLKPDVTNVVFVNGALDPWRSLGVLEDLNELAPAIVIPYMSHCSDMYAPSPYDIPELTAARQRIAQLVAQWIS